MALSQRPAIHRAARKRDIEIAIRVAGTSYRHNQPEAVCAGVSRSNHTEEATRILLSTNDFSLLDGSLSEYPVCEPNKVVQSLKNRPENETRRKPKRSTPQKALISPCFAAGEQWVCGVRDRSVLKADRTRPLRSGRRTKPNRPSTATTAMYRPHPLSEPHWFFDVGFAVPAGRGRSRKSSPGPDALDPEGSPSSIPEFPWNGLNDWWPSLGMNFFSKCELRHTSRPIS